MVCKAVHLAQTGLVAEKDKGYHYRVANCQHWRYIADKNACVSGHAITLLTGVLHHCTTGYEQYHTFRGQHPFTAEQGVVRM